jgi:hypothetical protein
MEQAAQPEAGAGDATGGDAGAPGVETSTPAATSNASFWRTGTLPDDVFPERITGENPGALLLRLGALPFWRGREPLTDALLPVYERAATVALEVLADLTRKS